MNVVHDRSIGQQRGIAAVELAVMLPVLVLMLVIPLYLGRVFWHYTTIQHAAHDAARYLSTIPAADLSNPARAVAAMGVANAIVTTELEELSPGAYPYGVVITCDGSACMGFFRPTAVRVNVSLLVQDVVFDGVNPMEIPLVADVTYPYMGR